MLHTILHHLKDDGSVALATVEATLAAYMRRIVSDLASSGGRTLIQFAHAAVQDAVNHPDAPPATELVNSPAARDSLISDVTSRLTTRGIDAVETAVAHAVDAALAHAAEALNPSAATISPRQLAANQAQTVDGPGVVTDQQRQAAVKLEIERSKAQEGAETVQRVTSTGTVTMREPTTDAPAPEHAEAAALAAGDAKVTGVG